MSERAVRAAVLRTALEIAHLRAGAFEQLPDRRELRRLGLVRRARDRQLVGGNGADDTDLMRALPGWVAKRGAEGLVTALSPDGVGWAFKVEDGSTRALRPAIGQVLGIESFRTVELRNTLGEAVGSIS